MTRRVVPIAESSVRAPKRAGSDTRWHCIIQWYEDGQRRPQDNFWSSNPLSCRLSASCLDIKSVVGFESGMPCHFSHAGGELISEKRLEQKGHTWTVTRMPREIQLQLNDPRSMGSTLSRTTDIILYGHSTFRTYDVGSGHALLSTGEAKETRGISVEGRFVSAKEVASFLNRVFGTYGCSTATAHQLRIWCCNCHMSDIDLNTPSGSYLRRLSYRLYKHGWRGFQVFGFKPEVTHKYHLAQIRRLAPTSAIGTFDVLKQIGSGRSWYVDALGNIVTGKSSKKLTGQELTLGTDNFDF